MFKLTEVAYALVGIGRLMRFDRQGLSCFDHSVQGFWRSFSVALLAAPLYALLTPQRLEAAKPTAGWYQVMAVEFLIYAVRWLLYPTIAFELCRWLRRQSEYPGYIVVYNWSFLLAVGTQVIAWLPSLAGITTTEFSELLQTVAYCLMQIYWWFIAREALKIDGVVAVAFVLVNVVLTLILSAVYLAIVRAGT